MSDRLRQARINAGYESATAAARAFGWEPAAYRHHENGTRAFDVDTAKRYAKAFKVKPGWLLSLDKDPAPTGEAALRTIEVTGAVAAGVWKEGVEWQEDERYEVVIGPSPFPKARRFGLEVEGLSMDLEFPPGTILDCLSIFDVGEEPDNNDFVVVERVRADGKRELTVKQFHRDAGGRTWLLPRSSQPEFQTPIEVGQPNVDHDTDSIVQVIAFVIGSYQPRSTRFMARQQPRRARRR